MQKKVVNLHVLYYTHTHIYVYLDYAGCHFIYSFYLILYNEYFVLLKYLLQPYFTSCIFHNMVVG